MDASTLLSFSSIVLLEMDFTWFLVPAALYMHAMLLSLLLRPRGFIVWAYFLGIGDFCGGPVALWLCAMVIGFGGNVVASYSLLGWYANLEQMIHSLRLRFCSRIFVLYGVKHGGGGQRRGFYYC